MRGEGAVRLATSDHVGEDLAAGAQYAICFGANLDFGMPEGLTQMDGEQASIPELVGAT